MQPRPFGATPQGEPAQLWTWTNAAGARIAVSEMGATLVALEAPDREGRLADLALGFDGAEAYAANGLYAGAIVGRFANRIAGAAFSLDGRRCALSANSGAHCLHGGVPGLHQKRWRAEPSPCGRSLRLTVQSPAGEAGFPGNFEAVATYQWTDDHTLVLDLSATVDQPCPVSLAPHAYWNLDGHAAGSIAEHQLHLEADAFTPAGPDLIPTGEIMALPDAFAQAPPLAQAMRGFGGDGLDHNVVLRGEGLRPAVRLWSPRSGRRLTLSTDRPGLQIYTLNTCPKDLIGGKGGASYGVHSALALEPQAFPDSPNQPAFPSTILRPNEVFHARSIFAFDTADRVNLP